MAAVPGVFDSKFENLIELLSATLSETPNTPDTSPMKGKHDLPPKSREIGLPMPKRHSPGLITSFFFQPVGCSP